MLLQRVKFVTCLFLMCTLAGLFIVWTLSGRTINNETYDLHVMFVGYGIGIALSSFVLLGVIMMYEDRLDVAQSRTHNLKEERS
jgi:hypothetical protein